MRASLQHVLFKQSAVILFGNFSNFSQTTVGVNNVVVNLRFINCKIYLDHSKPQNLLTVAFSRNESFNFL